MFVLSLLRSGILVVGEISIKNEIDGAFFTGIIMIRNMCIINANLVCSSIVRKS